MNKLDNKIVFEKLVGLFEETQVAMQTQAARSIDIALVVRNWLFGWYIAEFEKSGATREEIYGKEIMPKLSKRLSEKLGKGFSRRSLDQFRQFYEANEKIWQTVPAKSQEHSRLFVNSIFLTESKLNKNPHVVAPIRACLPGVMEIWQALSAKFNLKPVRSGSLLMMIIFTWT